MNRVDRESGGDAYRDVGSVVRREYDWSTTNPSAAVVRSVALAADRDPTDLQVLQQTIDADGLNAVLKTESDGTADVTVSFAFAGHDVTVHGDGFVVVRPAESDTA